MPTKIKLSSPAPSSTEFALTSYSVHKPAPNTPTGPANYSISIALSSDIGEHRNKSWGGLEAKRMIHQIETGDYTEASLSAFLLKKAGFSGTLEGAEEGLTELETALLDGPEDILLADLPAWLEANVTRENDARVLREKDTRTTSKPIYDERIDALLNGANSEPAV